MSIQLRKLGLAAIATFAGLIFPDVQAVNAASFTFSYLFESGALVAGSIEAEIQTDGNTLTALSNINATLTNDVEGNQTWSTDNFSSFSLSEPTISLDGTLMDWSAGSDEGGAFDFRNGISEPSAAFAGGSVDMPFNVSTWSIQESRSVPEPGIALGSLLSMVWLSRVKRLKVRE